MTNNEGGFFSKKGQRRMSSFIGHELLYDYMTGALDEERRKSLEQFIEENKEIQTEIQKIKSGISYIEKLSETKVSEALLERVKVPTSYLQLILQRVRFDEWPPIARMSLEASIVALGVAVLAIVTPWNRLIDFKIGSTEVVLSEVNNELSRKKSSETEVGAKEELSFPDEGVSAVTTTTNPPAPKKAVAVAVTTTTQVTTTTIETQETNLTAESKKTGSLYRGTIKITNAKASSAKIAEEIAVLGARKAGNVELGWSKGAGAYFHFTMPESNYDQMIEAFKEYGDLKINKEKHERIMPEGIVRIIITVDEKK